MFVGMMLASYRIEILKQKDFVVHLLSLPDILLPCAWQVVLSLLLYGLLLSSMGEEEGLHQTQFLVCHFLPLKGNCNLVLCALSRTDDKELAL